MKAQGGKTIYGAVVGILMLETRFPRIVGDMGNAATWPFPVFYRTVKGATPDLVVRKGAAGLKDAFIETARSLVDEGVDGPCVEETDGGVQSALEGVPHRRARHVGREVVQRRQGGDLRVSASTVLDERDAWTRR